MSQLIREVTVPAGYDHTVETILQADGSTIIRVVMAIKQVQRAAEAADYLRPISEVFTGSRHMHRIQNALQNSGFVYLGELVQFSRTELQQLKGIAKNGVQRIETEMRKYGLVLGTTIPHTLIRPDMNQRGLFIQTAHDNNRFISSSPRLERVWSGKIRFSPF